VIVTTLDSIFECFWVVLRHCQGTVGPNESDAIAHSEFSGSHSERVARVVTKDGAGYGNPRLRLTCLNSLRLEAGDSRLQNESPRPKGGKGTLVDAAIPRPSQPRVLQRLAIGRPLKPTRGFSGRSEGILAQRFERK
jgi:hypothetical protein